MKTYLVGGAVRDMYMYNGLKEPKDRDFVVVGATPEDMIESGYKQVGADFPVFLHPETGEEYALARTETKNGKGYHGFDVDFCPSVTLEQDLERRDLTINSMAYDIEEDKLIDPFGGREDIDTRVLRHTSEAFADDPIRVLRVARFLARFGDKWDVHYKTEGLCHKVMAEEGDDMTPERVWLEINKALGERRSDLFFKYMCKFDTEFFEIIKALRDIPQPKDHHPEGDVFVHTMLCLARGSNYDARVKFAVLCHDLGKYAAMKRHGNLYGHEQLGLDMVDYYCSLLKVPNDYRELAMKVCEHHTRCHRVLEMTSKKVLKLITELSYFKQKEWLFHDFLKACLIDAIGRGEEDMIVYKQPTFLIECACAAKEVTAEKFVQQGLEGKKIGEAMHKERLRKIEEVKRKWKN